MLGSMSYSIFWLVLSIVLAIIEVVAMGIVTIWFAVGALVACIVALFHVAFIYQVIVFVVVSGVLLYYTRPIVKKYLEAKVQTTNADRAIGEYAEVIDDINNEKGEGTVKVFGQIWTARTYNGEKISAGEMVKVLEIKGVKLIVARKDNNK